MLAIKKNKLAMYILYPSSQADISTIIDNLSPKIFTTFKRTMQKQFMIVRLPKFELEERVDIITLFKQVGYIS